MPALVLYQSRLQHGERAALMTQNLAELLRHDIGDHFDRADKAFSAVAALLAQDKPLAPELTREAGLSGMWLLHPGREAKALLPAPTSALPAPLDLAKLNHAPATGFSMAAAAAGSAEPTIFLARRLPGKGGNPGAILLGAMPVAALEPMFLALKLGEHGSISLHDADGGLLMRSPQLPATGSHALAPDFQRALAADPQAGSYSGVGKDDDGMAQLYSYRRHSSHGFLIKVGVAQEDYLAPWWQEVAVLATAATGMILLTLLSGWNLLQSTRQREHSERNIAGLLEENRRLIASLFVANEEQRRQLAHDLHDEMGQWLAAIQVNARVIGDFLNVCGDAEQQQSVRTIADSALEINHVIRDMVRLLRPPLLDTMGLSPSLEELLSHWLKYQGRIKASLEFEGELEHLPEAVNIAVYRILQEALANVTKHAQATAVNIRVSNGKEADGERQQLCLVIEDDGVGMGKGLALSGRGPAGVGLLGIRERAVALGGSLEIAPGQPRGCRLTVIIPLAQRPTTKVYT